MGLRVVIHARAKRDMEQYVEWLQRRAPIATARWFANLQAHILDLADKGHHDLPALEARKTSRDLRESHFGKRPNVFRIIFYLEHESVHVIRVRRAQRRALTRKEIEEAMDGDVDDHVE